MNKKKIKAKQTNLKQVGLFLLDKSGSMDSIRSQAISGFNEYLTTLKKNNVDVDFTLMLFDTMSIETPYNHVSIKQVEPLNEANYIPRGGTPLYDAAVKGVEELEEYSKEFPKVAASVVIMTDGYENSSSKHDEKCLRKIVDRLTKQGNWTFAYMGANQDAWAQSAKIGITRGSTMDWAANAQGTAKAFTALASASVRNVNMMQASAARGAEMSAMNNTADYFSGAQNKVGGEK